MRAVLNRGAASRRSGPGAVYRPWVVVGQGAAALAASMGIGRFVYTPILPLMHAQAGLSASFGATLATANYIGYLLGALAGIFFPAIARSVVVLRLAMVVLVLSLALMPVTRNGAAWFGLRLVAGVTSALIFVVAVSAMLAHLREHGQHLMGWAFGGVGAGIALSGVLVLLLRSVGTWRSAWWACAALAVLFAAAAWTLAPESSPAAVSGVAADRPRTHRWFGALLLSYSLEGIGYIIAGTFLVAAIDQNASGPVGNAAWVVVGATGIPSCALWAWLTRWWSRPALLLAALVVQAVGIALPALVGGVAAALIAAALFGATFIGVASMVLALGAHLQFPRAVAILTTGYSIGQILGPLVVTPLLKDGYQDALLLGAAIVAAAAMAAGALRFRFPHQLGAQDESARSPSGAAGLARG